MQIKMFKIDQVKLSKSIQQKIKNKVSQNRGATIQKLTQLFDETENRTLITDVETTHTLLKNLEKYSPQLFNDIDEISENFYQGSIGNIHCAFLRNGEKVAIKSLRPGIKEKIISDFNNSENLISLASNFVNTEKFDSMQSFSKIFIRSLENECNFDNEISNYRKISQHFDHFQRIKLPKLYQNYSDTNFLVLEWIDSSMNLDQIDKLPLEDRQLIQKELSEFFYFFPLKYGITQEDSNLSNFLINGNNLFFIDYGKLEFIPLNFRIAFVKLLEVLERDEDISILDLYTKMGFDKKMLIPLENLLDDISRILLFPLLNDIVTNFENWEPTQKVDTIAHNLKWNLRSSAPMHYFSLTRSFFGYVKLSKLLKAPVNQSHIKLDLLNYYKNDLDLFKTKIKKRREYSFVNIKVTKQGKEKVNLHLPYTSIFELESLISDEIKIKLLKRDLNIKDLIESAIKEERAEVFALEEGNDTFQVFLTKS